MNTDIISIVIPVYNDWESFRILLQRLNELSFKGKDITFLFRVLAVDDCSSQAPEKLDSDFAQLEGIHVLHLARNLGHQKAIAVGLSYAANHFPGDPVIVMDADGEDKPEDVVRLIEAHAESPDKLIFARRRKRSEGPIFRFFYAIYKAAFRMLTGQAISFGNFCLVPAPLVRRVSVTSEIWNHFSAGILKSHVPFHIIQSDRGKRFAGRSKMNFSGLVLHGLSALSVHIDIVSVRILVVILGLMVASCVVILAVLYVKFFTPFATPGWATTIIVGFSIMVVQSFFISLFLVFVTLTHRTHRLFVPLLDSPAFIHHVENLHPRP